MVLTHRPLPALVIAVRARHARTTSGATLMLTAPFPYSAHPAGQMMWPWPAAGYDPVAAAAAAAVARLPVASLDASEDPWANPGFIAGRPQQLETHASEVEFWKHHAEEAMRLLSDGCESTWHGIGGEDVGLWPLATEQAGLQPPTPSSSMFATPDGSPGGSMSVPLPLSSLPQPMRLPVGPAPPIPAGRSPGAVAAGSLFQDLGVTADLEKPPGLGALPPPPGLTLARAASLPLGGAEAEGDSAGPAPGAKPASLGGAPSTSAQADAPAKLVVRTTSKGGSKALSQAGNGAHASASGPAAGLPQATLGAAPSAIMSSPSASMFPGPVSELSPGIFAGPSVVGGCPCTRIEWHIEEVRNRLQSCMGRPLVSPPFAACDLPNLRLMVFPDAREAVKTVRSHERKSLYAAMVRKGPLYGALKLKADCLAGQDTLVKVYFTVGAVRVGPLTYDFAVQAIHGCDDLGVDWLKQVDESTGGLRVAVEILAPATLG